VIAAYQEGICKMAADGTISIGSNLIFLSGLLKGGIAEGCKARTACA
jgi:hypothetical protein